MKNTCFTLLCCFLTLSGFSQNTGKSKDFNLSFEKGVPGQKTPQNWFEWGTGYVLGVDSIEKTKGQFSMSIKSPATATPNAFGSVAQRIPALYEGKEIELKGFMKYKNVANGFAGLLMRIDGDGNTIQFDNMQRQDIRGTADWKQYSIKLPYPKGAKSIIVGALLTGTGEIWVDDFEVFIDGKILNEAKPKEAAKAELDKEFDNGSKISLENLTASDAKEIAALGRLWGFLKYYHPAVASGNYNWDYEFFRIFSKLAAVNSVQERQDIVSKWIDSLGPVTVSKEPASEESEVKIKPDLAWINSSGFNEKLVAGLNAVKNAKRPEEHYYIGLFPNVGNPEFKNEKAYPNMNYQDAGYRLLGLFRYWNMIEYFFPYKKLIEEDWYGVLNEYVPKFVNASNETEYKLAMLQLIGRVKDTHANIFGQDLALTNYFGTKYAPLEINFIEGKPVVTDYFDKVLGENTGLKKGDIIEKINGRSIDQIIKEKLPLMPASNYSRQLKNLAPYLLRTNDSLLVVEFKRGGELKKQNVACYNSQKANIYARYAKKDTCFKMLRSDISYLYPGTIKNKYLPELAPEILKTKGLVIDMRCYPSDFIVFTLGSYLLPSPVPFVKFSKGSISQPGLFTIGKDLVVGKINKDFYKGKVVIIVNETTISNAEYTTMALRTAPEVTIIGSTTAAADGNVSQIVLPGNIPTGISGIGVYYPDGRETQRVGIVPQVEIKPTIEGIIEGKDELLEKAIAIIDGK